MTKTRFLLLALAFVVGTIAFASVCLKYEFIRGPKWIAVFLCCWPVPLALMLLTLAIMALRRK